jgi:hypothetical protein
MPPDPQDFPESANKPKLAPDTGVGAVLGADVEALRWDPWETHAFYVSVDLDSFLDVLIVDGLLGLVRKWPRTQL